MSLVNQVEWHIPNGIVQFVAGISYRDHSSVSSTPNKRVSMMSTMNDNGIGGIRDKGRKIGEIELSWHPDLIQNSAENSRRS